VSCTFTVSDATVTSIAVSFAGELGDTAATASNPFAVTPAPTSLTVTSVGPTHLVATLLTEGSPLVGQIVHLSLGGQACAGTTNAVGVAACDIPPVGTPTATLSASFPGTASYATSSASTAGYTIPTVVTTTLTYTGPGSAAYGATVTLSTLLVDASNNAVAGRSVHLTLGTQNCTGTTSSTGVASCTLALTQAVGSYTVSASYAGDATTTGSTASTPFTITRAPPAINVLGVFAADYHDPALVSAQFRGGVDMHPLANEQLTILVGTQSCITTTSALGLASCSITITQAPGAYVMTATFAGDAGNTGSTTAADSR
jgi:hypothetical protein